MTDTDRGGMAGAGFDGFKPGHRDHAPFLTGKRDLDAGLIDQMLDGVGRCLGKHRTGLT